MAPLAVNVHSCDYCRRYGYDLRKQDGEQWPGATLQEIHDADAHTCLFFRMILDEWTVSIDHRFWDEDLAGSSRLLTHNDPDI